MHPSNGDDVIFNNLNDDLTPDDPDNGPKGADRTQNKDIDDIHKVLPRVVIEPDLLRVMGHLPKQG